jgi:hypothetical protein
LAGVVSYFWGSKGVGMISNLILKQLITQPKPPAIIDYYFLENRSYKLNHTDRLLFLRIFKEVRKKVKRGSQFDVASKIKEIFLAAKNNGTFEYLSETEYKYDFERELYDFKPYSAESLELRKESQKLLRDSFFKEIGLTEKSYNYLYGGYFSFNELEGYYAHATPAAIVQMKKRLRKR